MIEHECSPVNWESAKAAIKRLLPFPKMFKSAFPDSLGRNGNINCPFCGDRGGHFQVNSEFGFCHKEDRGYDIFHVHQAVNNCDFKTALRELARQANVELPKGGRRRAEELGEPSVVYAYRDESGVVVMEVCRWNTVNVDGTPGKIIRQRRPDGNGGYHWNLGGVSLPIFRLPEIVQAPPDAAIHVHEGEKAVLAACELGFVATCNPMGAGKWTKQCKDYNISEPLKDRIIWVFPDNDDHGRSHATDIAESLSGGFARSVKIVELPGLPPKGDVYDFVQIHGSDEARRLILRAAEDAPEYVPDPNYGTATPKKSGKARVGEEPTKFQKLVDLFDKARGTVFRDQHKAGWSTIDRKTHYENVRLSSGAFKRHLIRLHADAFKDGVSRELTSQVADYLTERATDERCLHNRFAWRDETLLIDMGTPEWDAVEIAPQGWKIVRPIHPPFQRYLHQQPLPMPDPTGNRGALVRLLDLLPLKRDDRDTQILVIVWLILAIVPHIPRPGLVLHGPQGAGKSGVARILRDLTDPSSTTLLSLSKDHGEFVQVIDHHAIVNLDNLSGLPSWAANDLCMAVTGGGFTKRQLYTDDDDFVSSFRRTFILNGINIPSLAPDLLDRSILIQLERLPDEQRRDEAEIRAEFDRIRSHCLGAVFTILSQAMGAVGSIVLDRTPRMADWTRWGCAVADVAGIGQSNFLAAYEHNREGQNEEILTSDPVCNAVISIAAECHGVQWRPAELYERLTERAKQEQVSVGNAKYWPQNPQALTRKLNILSHNLRVAGITISTERGPRQRTIVIQMGEGARA